MIVELRNVYFRYSQPALGPETAWALENISVSVRSGERLAVVGASGSGKTTLVQMLNGLLQPTTGEVWVDGHPAVYSGQFVRSWRRRVGLVFQFPEIQFFGETIQEELAFAPRNFGIPEEEIEQRIRWAMQLVELEPEVFLKRSPFEISEGQKRRVAIASVLVVEPEVLVLDEPTAGLDFRGIQALSRILAAWKTQKRALVLVSHDMDFVAQHVDRIVALNRGRLVFDGPKQDFFLCERLMREVHVEPPRVLRVAEALRKKGIAVSFPVFSVEGLKRELRKSGVFPEK